MEMEDEMEEVVEREVKAGGEKKKEIRAAGFDERALRNIKAKLEAGLLTRQEAASKKQTILEAAARRKMNTAKKELWTLDPAAERKNRQEWRAAKQRELEVAWRQAKLNELDEQKLGEIKAQLDAGELDEPSARGKETWVHKQAFRRQEMEARQAKERKLRGEVREREVASMKEAKLKGETFDALSAEQRGKVRLAEIEAFREAGFVRKKGARNLVKEVHRVTAKRKEKEKAGGVKRGGK
ncbi:hypothetical protein QC764_0051190 [Podospora pseudoanserina]|uniref:Ribosomal RNA-processing protein 14/surfeit locus protein 6 C-terminal domain-containing protein n=1 Tax=Podospora pseudoanserina TaxID=2609844 RepID=A0ABR0ICZ0_9PEZI|nr:hypothetical protein QC764_0051190 [Podospora pseudoanserina]